MTLTNKQRFLLAINYVGMLMSALGFIITWAVGYYGYAIINFILCAANYLCILSTFMEAKRNDRS